MRDRRARGLDRSKREREMRESEKQVGKRETVGKEREN